MTFPNTAARSPGTTVTAAAAGTVGLGVGAVSGDYSDANVADLFNTNTLAGFNLNAASGLALDTTAGSFTQSTALTAARPLTKLGNNTLTLTGANTYSGRTTISSGTLELGGAAGKLGTGPITNNGTLRLNRTNALSVAGPIDGTGTLTQVGTGTTTLSGVGTYSGATTITAGTLRPAVGGGSSLWLDSAKTSSLATSGTAVTQWSDAGGGTNFATQGNAAARPNLTTDNAFTGPSKTMVDFGATTSSGQWMQFNANITDIRSVFWVMKGGNFLLGSTGAYDFHREEATVASPTGKIWSTPYTNANIQNGQTYLNGTQVNGTTTALSGGYQMIDVITTGNVQSNALANDRNIGGRIGGQQIGEVIIFNAALSNTDRVQVETYLNYKWFGNGSGVGNLLPATTPVTISGNGTLDLSGENFQTIASLSSSDSTTRVTLGGAALTVGDANDTTFAGVISDTGTLTKVGTGKLTLTGANTHSGRTTINNGTLELSGAGKLGSGPITTNAALRFSPSTTLSVPSAINGTGGLTHAGTGTTTLTGALTYGGATDISGGTLRIVGVATAPVAGAARRFDASNLGLADGAGVSTWNDLSGNGANATVPGGNATPTYIANAGTGTGLGAINLPKNGGAAASGAFTFTRDANVRSMFSIFKGNSFLATDSTGGTYALHRPTDDNAADALLADYGQINYLGSVYVNGSLVGAPLTTPMPTNVANGYNLVEVITNGNAFALDSFNKDRGTIHAGNQSQAEVLIYDTVLTESQRLHNESYLSNKWFGNGAAAALPSNTPVTISNGGTLDLIGAQTIGSLSSTDTLGSKVFNDTSLTVGNATNTTFDGAISGPGTLTKTGAGRLTLTGANTYAGVTTISNGTLELGGTAGALGTSTAAIANNGTLSINRTNALILRNAITGTGGLTQAGTGTITLTGTNTYAGATNITGGTLSVSAVTGAARRFDASNLGLANGAGVSTWSDLSGNGANATVPGGNGTPTFIANAGTGTGLGAISFLGNTNATDSQALAFTRDTNVRSMFSVFKGSSFLATDSVNYSLHRPNDNNPADPLLIDYGQVNFLGTVYVNSSLVATPTTTPMPTASNNGYNLVEIIGNGNAFALDSFNKDRIYHSGNQSQAEVLIFDTVVSNEQRQQIETYLNYKWFGTGAGIGNLLPATTPVTLSGGGTLDLGGENYQTIASLSSSDPTSRVTLGAAALTVGDASSTSFAGAISGPGKLTKVGNGTLTLAGTSTYTGPTTVNSGTLIVSGSLSGSAVTVDGSGSTVGGGGNINGTVTVQNGATIAPGNSPGKLSTLSLSMASGTTLSLELNGPTPVTGYDQLSVTGAVNLGGATLSISTGVGFLNGDYFVVLNDGTDAITGTFTGLAEGGMFSVGDKDFTITYTANAEGMSLTGGNDVAFTVVPEPGSAMLLLGGIATMLGVRRRRVEPS